MKHRFIIIGMDDNRSPFFPPEALAQIRKGKVFSGGIRHKEIVGPLLPAGAEWISITVPLERVFSRYEEIFARFEETATDDSIIVFASGDPLFFGFANTIKRKLPEADILLYPAFNSLQTLAHRLVMPYDDMRTVSLTGRPWQEFDRALIERAPKIGILTDREHTPATIAARMLEYGYSHYTLYIGEHLGNPEKERIRRMTPREAVAGDFEHPNCLLLDSHPGQCRTNSLHGSVQAPDFPVRPFGIPDEEFAHLDGRARMITKAPIRLLTLQALELNRRRVFWDILFHLSRREGVAILVTTHYMGEAEHCDHLALMFAGKVVADASPEQMKQAVTAEAGQLLELRVDRPAPAQAALVAAGFASAVLHGRAVHLLSKAADADLARLPDILAAAGVQLQSVQPRPLSMEDVFVHQVSALEAAQRGSP